MSVTIFHNPRCSKSRQTLALLEEKGVAPEIVEYLNAPPSAVQLDRILTLLGKDPREVMRRKEEPYKTLNLDDPALDRQALIAAMVEHPILIERPIVVNGDRAALGRPPRRRLENPLISRQGGLGSGLGRFAFLSGLLQLDHRFHLAQVL